MGYIESDRPSVSGGDMRWLKFAQWLTDHGHTVTVLSTAACGHFLTKCDCRAKFISVGNMGGATPLNGIKRILYAIGVVPRLRKQFDCVYSVSDLIHDVLPGFLLKLFSRVKWVVVCHWVTPLTGRKTRALSALLFFAGNKMGSLLSGYADLLLCVSEPTLAKVRKQWWIHNDRTSEVGCGTDLAMASGGQTSPKQIDAINIKRIALAKGTYDLPEIWRLVRQSLPAARLMICGEGSDEEVTTLRQLIDQAGMKDAIEYPGVIYDQERKYALLHSARVFVLPSYEENWAIVIGEALASGLEVVCYDLPDIRPVWGNSLHWVPVGDKAAFADKVVRILTGQEPSRRLPLPHAVVGWDQVCEREYGLMAKVLEP